MHRICKKGPTGPFLYSQTAAADSLAPVKTLFVILLKAAETASDFRLQWNARARMTSGHLAGLARLAENAVTRQGDYGEANSRESHYFPNKT